MSLITKYLSVWVIIPVLLILSLGCDNSLNPLDEDKGNFSIYGYLDLDKKINYIRVKNLNTTFREDTGGNIDAEVTLTNLDEGITETLQDTIVVFDGVKTHNFRTTIDIRPGTAYKVSAESSGGRKTTAKATAPLRAETGVMPKVPNCTTRVNLSFNPVETVFSLKLEIGFEYKQDMFWVTMNDYIADSEGGVTASFEPWTVLKKVFEVVEEDEITRGQSPFDDVLDEGEVFCHQLDSEFYYARYSHYSPKLFQNTISDTLAIPDGAGRFGAFYSDSFTFKIDTTKLCPPVTPLSECVGLASKQTSR